MNEAQGGGHHVEVALTSDAKLVLVRAGSTTFVRLRAQREGEWRFLSPALSLSPSEVEGLSSDIEDSSGYPVVLGHEKMEGKLNLLVYQGRIHVHFGKGQMNGSAQDLRAAFKALA